MGKKYIIELEDNQSVYKTINKKDSMIQAFELLSPTPYTAPDLEKVRKESYQKGYDDAVEKIGSDEQAIADKAYQKGLSDAWDAARTLWNTPNRKEIFGHTTFNTVLTTLTAQKAIEKIRQYEQAKEEQIKVGDEVISPNGKGVVTEITDIYIRIMYAKGSGQVVKPEDLTKTGRHFAEIAEVLAKMKETNNG